MRHSAGIGASLACALIAVACGGGTRTADQSTNGNGAAADNPLLNSAVRPEPITATGCLTASDGRYVVTSLDDAAAVPTTVTYQLNGGDKAALQNNVNREVRVAGEADPAKIANVRELGAPAVGTSGRETETSSTQPKAEVTTQQAMRFEVRTLKVSSITPTGDPCEAAAAGGASAR
jgi:hypothetical protein